MRTTCLVFALLVSSSCASGPANRLNSTPHTILDACGDVERFHGVPIRLSVSDVRSLPYGSVLSEETIQGDTYVVAKVAADRLVEIKVTFDDKGQSYMSETASSNAIGPRNIRVGSTLLEVKAAWPSGRLVYGDEDGRYVTFSTGTNVKYGFNPAEMPPGAFDFSGKAVEVPNLAVTEIRIYSRAQCRWQ